MKSLSAFLLSLAPALLFAAEPSGIAIAVSHIPADATELVAVIDTVAPLPAPEYQEPAAPAPVVPPPAAKVDPVIAPAPAEKAEKPAAPAAAKGDQPRGRRGRRGTNAAAFSPMRRSVATHGATSATINVPVPAGENYQVRVVALRGGTTSPAVLAGARFARIVVEAEKSTVTELSLQAPSLKLAPENPASVAPGAPYTLAGTITDPAGCLGSKSRMRIWMSVGAPPRENFAGAQISTIDVTTEGNDVKFSFALTAPAEPTTLYFQFGELPDSFARPDGTQAAFLVLPNLAAGEAPLALRVQ